jgi:DNA-binding response OmpR family regulator
MAPPGVAGPEKAQYAPGSRWRVLLVDDEQAIRSAISRALTTEGIAIDTAETGAVGLRRALAKTYDLVILDLLMPGVDGRTVLRELVRARSGQPVLMLSCLADVRSKVDCFDLGARDYLTKPFSLDEPLARVRNQLRADRFDQVIRVGDLALSV